MKLIKKIPFKFEDKRYEIRILFGNNTINIVAFCNNHPANGYRHQIQIPKNMDPEKLLETEPFKEMIELSKKDIFEKRWDKMMVFF